MPLGILGNVTVLNTLAVLEVCTRPMCFVFCQSINNKITMTLTLQLQVDSCSLSFVSPSTATVQNHDNASRQEAIWPPDQPHVHPALDKISGSAMDGDASGVEPKQDDTAHGKKLLAKQNIHAQPSPGHDARCGTHTRRIDRLSTQCERTTRRKTTERTRLTPISKTRRTPE